MLRMEIYSKDLRIRAVEAVERGIPRKEVVEIFAISLRTLKHWIKIRREGKDLSPGISTGRRRRILSTPEEERALWEQLVASTTMPPYSATASCGRKRGACASPSRP